MKQKLLLLIALVCFNFAGCTQVPIDEMNTENWSKDITYLNSKIQRQFATFNPALKKKFDKEARELIQKLPKLENYQVTCEIMRILSVLEDGHTELNIGQQTVNFHRIPFSLYFFEDELYILATHDKYSHLLGGRILKFNEYSTGDIFKKLKSTMSRDNEMEYLHAGPSYIILTELLACLGVSPDPLKVTLSIELEDGSIILESFDGGDLNSYNKGPWLSLTKKKGINTPVYLSQRESHYWYKYFPESNIMYFNFTRINNQKGKSSIKKFIAELFKEIDLIKPDKLVVDFRLNNGGNYNLSRPLIDAIKERDWLNKKGKLWAITGRRTFSAASATAIFLKQETETTLIGEVGRTHPNQADNNEYMNLPVSNLLIEYTTKVKEHWPERPELDRVPVDIEIIPDFKSYSEGKDKVMEFIISR